jgi:hypothetical protein
MDLRIENHRPFSDLISSGVPAPSLATPFIQVPSDRGTVRKPCVPAHLDTRSAADVKGRESAVAQTNEESRKGRREIVRGILAVFGVVSAVSLFGWTIMDLIVWWLQNGTFMFDNSFRWQQ